MQRNLGRTLYTSTFHPSVLKSILKTADVVIGTLRHIAGNKRFIVTEDYVREMKKGAVIIDLSVDQGGCFETSECDFSKKRINIREIRGASLLCTQYKFTRFPDSFYCTK